MLKRHDFDLYALGATYAEFIFISVVFNSTKFWALMAVEIFVIIFMQGGVKVDAQTIVLNYFTSQWFPVRLFKTLFLNLVGGMPYDMAAKAAQCTTDDMPPEIQLALIRSRALVVQSTWAQNDIKMASEFQSLACASTAVAADIMYSYFEVGESFINTDLNSKRGILFVYLVNLCGLFIAQAVARRRLGRKVAALKSDISAVVSSIVAANKAADMDDAEKGERRDSNRRSIRDLKATDMIRLRKMMQHESQGLGGIDEENDNLNDLQDILDMTDVFSSTKTPVRRKSDFALEEFSHDAQEEAMDQPANDTDDWGDVNLGDDDNSSNLNNIAMQGYLKKQKPGTSKYQRRYFVLSKDNNLIYYANQNDISKHVSHAKGIINMAEALYVVKAPMDPLGFDVIMRNRTYSLQAYTESEAAEWFAMLNSGVTLGGVTHESDVTDERKSSPSLCSSLPVNARRSSVAIMAKSPFAAPCPTLEPKQGYLKKRNALYWQQRWFELRQPGELVWFVSENDSSAGRQYKGSVPISAILSVEQSLRDPCLFDIDIKGRTYELMALSEGLAREWCTALAQWMEHVPHNTEEIRPSIPAAPDDPRDGDMYAVYGSLSTADEEANGIPSEERKGYLKKKGGLTQDTWQVRWFELKHPGTLTWYGSESDVVSGKKAKGKLLMDYVSDVQFGDNQCCLVLHTPDKVYELQAETASIAKQWMESLIYFKSAAVVMDSRDSSFSRSIMPHRLSNISRNSDIGASKTLTRLPSLPEDVEGVFDARVEKRGVLEKKGGVANNVWQTRWFELKYPGELLWYAKEVDAAHGKTPKGKLSLKDVKSVAIQASDSRLIDVTVEGRVYMLRADSEVSAQSWCSVLRAWLSEDTDGAPEITDRDAALPERDTLATTDGIELQNVNAPCVTADDEEKKDEKLKLPDDVRESDVMRESIIPSEPLEMSGYLKKKGGFRNSTWQSRWFCLRKPGILSWYTDEFEMKSARPCKGSVLALEMLAVDIRDGNVIDLSVKGRIYELMAPTRAEAQSWKTAFVSWLLATDPALSALPQRSSSVVMNAGQMVSLDSIAGRDSNFATDQQQIETVQGSTSGEPDTPTDVSSTVPLITENSEDVQASLEMDEKKIQNEVALAVASQEGALSDGVIAPLLSDDAMISNDEVDDMGEASEVATRPSVSETGQSSVAKLFSSVTEEEDSTTRASFKREGSLLPRAWDPQLQGTSEYAAVGQDEQQFDEDDEEVVVKETGDDDDANKQRRDSEIANKLYLKQNRRRDSDEFVNNLKTRSYQDLNSEFWIRHRWYLTAVVCFVTLHVLYATAYIVRVD